MFIIFSSLINEKNMQIKTTENVIILYPLDWQRNRRKTPIDNRIVDKNMLIYRWRKYEVLQSC